MPISASVNWEVRDCAIIIRRGGGGAEKQGGWISFTSSIQFQLFFPQAAPVFLDLILETGLLGDNETLTACPLKRF